MKKLYTTEKYKCRNKCISTFRNERRLNTKFKRKIKRRIVNGLDTSHRIVHNVMQDYQIIPAPDNFSFINFPEETVNFINKLEVAYRKRSKVFVNLSKLKSLDYSAVTVLLSVMFTFKSKKIGFNGNFPKDKSLRKLLVESDFFKYISRSINDEIEYEIGKQNQIFTKANKEVNAELGLKIMEEASVTIWEEKRICKGLQRTLLELMQNTNNHADRVEKGVKHWWLSVNHDKANKKVSFVFVDYGLGIFESLKGKPKSNKWYGWLEKIKTHLKNESNEEIMRMLLEGTMHLTVTGQHFRGKGLPGINEVFGRNQISNLHIVSNNVYTDIKNNNYRLLNNAFSGTFVYWELNELNINMKWIV